MRVRWPRPAGAVRLPTAHRRAEPRWAVTAHAPPPRNRMLGTSHEESCR